MQYSPKLKMAMEEVKAVLQKHDIGGMVVLHTPGFGEFLYKIDPSYSCAKLMDDHIRVKTDKEDPKEVKQQKVADTINLLTIISDLGAPMVMNTIDTLKMLHEHLDITDIHGDISSHQQQNN